jgi:hypothetical protein
MSGFDFLEAIYALLYCAVVFLYCVCALFVCNMCYLTTVLLYYCHRAEAQLQFNKYIYNTSLPPNMLHVSPISFAPITLIILLGNTNYAVSFLSGRA